MTLRRVKKRSALPVLAAFLVGSATAGTATVLAKPLDAPLDSGGSVLSASFTNTQRPPGAAGLPAPRSTASSTNKPPPTAPSKTTAPASTPPTTKAPPATPPASSTKPSDPPQAPPGQIDKVIDLVNQARADAGCAAVRVDAALTAAASGHSEDMSERSYFSHTTPEGVEFDVRIKEAGYPQPGAENIARGQKTADQVMDAWMKSPGHKANIVNCQLTAIGVGLDTVGFYWTQDFGY